MGASPRPTGRYGDEMNYRPMAEINVTPMVDVMLVLLVIFMVTAPLMVRGVPLELPKTSASKLSQSKTPTIVSLTKDGAIYLRDQKMEDGQLIGQLSFLREKEGDSVIYVRADRGVAYGEVMKMLGRIGEGGFARISLLADSAAETQR
jgi:biopolymer transport protein TolR